MPSSILMPSNASPLHWCKSCTCWPSLAPQLGGTSCVRALSHALCPSQAAASKCRGRAQENVNAPNYANAAHKDCVDC